MKILRTLLNVGSVTMIALIMMSIVKDNCHITGKCRGNFGVIPEKNHGDNNFENINYHFKLLEYVTIDIQSIIVNHLTI